LFQGGFVCLPKKEAVIQDIDIKRFFSQPVANT